MERGEGRCQLKSERGRVLALLARRDPSRNELAADCLRFHRGAPGIAPRLLFLFLYPRWLGDVMRIRFGRVKQSKAPYQREHRQGKGCIGISDFVSLCSPAFFLLLSPKK